jgi:hypothetical protein
MLSSGERNENVLHNKSNVMPVKRSPRGGTRGSGGGGGGEGGEEKDEGGSAITRRLIIF